MKADCTPPPHFFVKKDLARQARFGKIRKTRPQGAKAGTVYDNVLKHEIVRIKIIV